MAIALLVSLGFGGAVASWHAVRSVRTEIQAAVAVGAQTLRNGIDKLPRARDPASGIEPLVRTFDGDRHVRAIWHDASGRPRIASKLGTVRPRVPVWFAALFAPSRSSERLDVGAGEAITIEPDPRNEIGEVWTQFQDDLVVAGLSCALSSLLISMVVGSAFRPLGRLSAAFALVGAGECAVRIDPAGPPELRRLADGFNAMAQRLDAVRLRNLRLDEQLLNLQEEERRELARDLHDEVGPFLFTVNLDAASIEQSASDDRVPEVAERARAIREAVEHMQRHVRAMLHRLRPASPVAAGLAPALAHLVDFWRVRQPDVDFALAIAVDEDRLGDPTMAAIYRVIQEGLTNAIRHGRPHRIEIAVQAFETGPVTVRVADTGAGRTGRNAAGLGLPRLGLTGLGSTGLGLTGLGSTGLGLTGLGLTGLGLTGLGSTGLGSTGLGLTGLGLKGMRERVEGLGGTLDVIPNTTGKGLVVTARLPCAAAMEVA
ncbi:histidine kinase [Rhodopila sp.]|uniref:histidine kinase n=1 Tax=Rhodopila sp. TaxID=2480087 RepID=UPI003D0ADC28